MSNITFTRKIMFVACAVLFIALTLLLFNNYQHVTPFFQIIQEAACSKRDNVFSFKTVKKEIIDNSGAKPFLDNYDAAFNPQKQKPSVPPDPNNPETITTWYQAAGMIDWYFSSPLRYNCSNRTAKGNWHMCEDERYSVKAPCLVYSFGINWDYSFDDALSKLGCEVHSFDPSMKEKDHARGFNLSTFHNLGLSNINTDAFIPRMDSYVKDRQVWKMRTLKSIMRDLGHENRVIDVLKVDIEAYEWGVLDNIIESELLPLIRQFLIEFHLFSNLPLKEDYIYFYKVLTKFREMGFHEFAEYPNTRVMDAIKFNIQADMEYVNVFNF